MDDITPTRSAVLELKEERGAMQDGYVFLDEKCLLLAGEILRELKRQAALALDVDAIHRAAIVALASALARHGLEGLQVYPAPPADDSQVCTTSRSLMGVRLIEAAAELRQPAVPEAPDASPEAAACRAAFADLAVRAASLAAIESNLERLHGEYRRSVRRARALADVLLPETDRAIVQVDMRLSELEQEDAVFMRRGRAAAGADGLQDKPMS
jgi:V/A-type H+-transporting ATPase subunit D